MQHVNICFKFFYRLVTISLLISSMAGCSDLSAHLESKTERLEEIASLTQPLNKHFTPELGFGVNASGTRIYGNCVEYGQVGESDIAFDTRNTEESMVQSQEELAKKLEISANLQAKYLWAEGGGKISQLMDTTISQKSINWMVWGRYTLQPQMMIWTDPKFRLSAKAKKILNNPKIPLQEFFEVCGTHFFDGYIKGGMFVVLYQIENNEEKVIDHFHEEANLKLKGVLNGGQEFSKDIEQAKKHKAFKLSVAIWGGDEQVTKGLNADNLSSKEIWAVATRMQDSLMRNKGTVLEWTEKAYEDAFREDFIEARQMRERAKNKDTGTYPWDNFKDDLLAELFHQYHRNKNMLYDARIQYELLSDEIYDSGQQQRDLDELQKVMTKIEQQNKDITALAKACIEGKDDFCTPNSGNLNTEYLRVPDFSSRINDDLLSNWSLYFNDADNTIKNPEYDLFELWGDYHHGGKTDICTFYGSAGIARLNSSDFIALNFSSHNKLNSNHVIGIDQYVEYNKDDHFYRPMLCMEDFSKKCRMQMRPAKYSQKSKIEGQNFNLIFKLFDDFGYLEKKVIFDTSCRTY